MENVVRIQLVDGDQLGFLDVKEGTTFPINKKVSDIRDVKSRSGSYSKTITLDATKNNNKMLNHYFNLNIESGYFDINKLQSCVVIQNGIVILDNVYLKLMRVVTKEKVSELQYDEITYELQIRDSISDFYIDVNNNTLGNLTDWEKFNHIYSVNNIVASFDHTVDDGYKYILPWIDDTEYKIKELLPGIYAKQIWDRIHLQNGYSYDWAELSSPNVQFDKLILPYSGDIKKVSNELIESRRIKADRLTTTQWNQVMTSGAIFLPTPIINTTVPVINNNVVDPLSLYNPATSVYDNDLIINAPDQILYEVTMSWNIEVRSSFTSPIESYSMNPMTGTPSDDEAGMRPRMAVRDQYGAVLASIALQPDTVTNFGLYYPAMAGIPVARHSEAGIFFNGRFRLPIGPTSRVVCSGTNQSFTLGISEISNLTDLTLFTYLELPAGNNSFRVVGGGVPVSTPMRLNITSISIDIAPSADSGIIPLTELNLKNFIPNKMKQSEFLSSIYQKFNLYAVPDKENPRKIIYKSRDKFYKDGKLRDFTKKLCKELDQETVFLPEITSKKLILTYKDDDGDTILKAYKDETKETYAQVEATFDNENVKGVQRLEEQFAPTVNLRTSFDSVAPFLMPDFKYEPRILIDGGRQFCDYYTIRESVDVVVGLGYYPYTGMLDQPYNPKFSIEYAMPDYYGYPVTNPTHNNLYVNHWRRTLAQMNTGIMFKAYFWITPADMEVLELDDIIKVKESFFSINAIIDYDANALRPTLLELLIVDDDLKLFPFGQTPLGNADGDIPAGVATPFSPPIIPGTQLHSQKVAASEAIEQRWASTTVAPDGTSVKQAKGYGNTLPSGFRGTVIGDNQVPTSDGFYVDGTSLTRNGVDIGKDLSVNSTGLIIRDTNGTIRFSADGITFTEKYVEEGYWEEDYVEDTRVGISYTSESVVVAGELVLSTTKQVTSTADTSGVLGSIRYDDNYMYLKVTTGWKRIPLQVF